jgi:hypothetical protein
MGFAQAHFLAKQHRGLDDDEERAPVLFQLGTLMRLACVLDRQFVQVEFLLGFPEQKLVRLVQCEPDKCSIALQGLADVIDTDLAQSLSMMIGNAVTDHSRVVIAAAQRSVLLMFVMGLVRRAG